MPSTSNLGLPFIEAGQAQKHVTHNEALRLLDTLVQLAVLDRDLNSPPGSPGEGQRWLVKASPSPTGAWAGHGSQIAAWQDGAWQFSAPAVGWLAYVVDESVLLAWDGDSWDNALDVVGDISELQNLGLLGVGTAADTTNPFAAKLNNALWVAKTVAEGGDGDLRYKLSKESAAKTLSFLLQDNYSGRAELGLIGDDDLQLKVSPDGSAWIFALRVAKSTGLITLPAALSLSDANQLVTKSHLDAAILNAGKRARVRAATTANVNLSNALESGDTIDGVTLAVGDLVLLKDQSTAAQNGIYGVPASGAASRAAEFDTYNEHPGSLVSVEEGTANADTLWICTSNEGGTLDTSAIAWSRIRIDISIPVTIAQGGTNATDAATARANLAAAASGANSDIASLAALASVNGGQLAGFRNLLSNPYGRINQRAPASSADDTYGHDRWYALTQTGPIAVSTVNDAENGTPRMWRLTQSQASAQRMGYAQIIEAANCKHLRGKQATFGGRVRCSASQALRYAILEWTGTEDSVVSDVVNDWTNGTFTAGQFFKSTTLNVLGVGTITPGAATLADLAALTVTIGSSANNLIVLLWIEGTAAQNVTLDGALQLEVGAVASAREQRELTLELNLCRRYYQQYGGDVANQMFGAGVAFSTTGFLTYFPLPVQMRAAPTFSVSAAADFEVVTTALFTCSAVTGGTAAKDSLRIDCTVSGMTAGHGGLLRGVNTTNARIKLDAEL